MKQHYSSLISLIQQQNTLQNKIRETTNKSGDIKQKYQHVDASQLIKELDAIKEENKKLEEKLRGQQLLRSSILAPSH
jgi:regulator of replication initiation timing